MSYLPPFAFVKQKYKITANADRDHATLMYRDLLDIVKLLLRGVTVDDPWYLATYPDVAEAIEAGMFKSAKHHFVENGYFEGRRPAQFEVDEEWYLTTYPDVTDGIEAGKIVSATKQCIFDALGLGPLIREY